MPRSCSAPSEALIIIAILKRIPRNRFITTGELGASLKEAGIDLEPRRLQRLMQSIVSEESLHIECDRRAKPYGYRQRIPQSDLAETNLRPPECLLLRLAEEHLRYQLPAQLMKSMLPLFDAARVSLHEEGASSRASSWLKKVAFVSGTVPMQPPKIKERIFMAVSEALYRESKLRIVYCNAVDERRKAVISPLGLVQQEQRLYLVCRFDGYDNVRHLALHRIESAEVLEFSADRPKDFSLDKYIAERHFNFSSGRKIRFVLEFLNSSTAKNLTETPFNSTQRLERLQDGAWRLTAVMDDTVLLDGWVAAWKERAGIRRAEKLPVLSPEGKAAGVRPAD